MKKVAAILALVSVVALQGCSAFKPATQTVNFQCSEPGTTITINGLSRTCPAQIEMKRNRDVSIQAYKEGYAPYMRTVGHHLSGTGTMDIVGALLVLVPGVGLLTPGAWDLDETDILIQLMPTAAAKAQQVTSISVAR